MYIIRLDDASEQMDHDKWNRMEILLDKYKIKPIVGIIPINKDPELCKYRIDHQFWERVTNWSQKGWIIALHGYNHLYVTENSGINPIHKRSEFAGLSVEVQKKKLKDGFDYLKSKNIIPTVFFAPSHTYDSNTIVALKEVTSIRIVSDTVASDVYFEDGIHYIPVQSGKVRKLPFATTTFCLHPNMMQEEDFKYLESFLMTNKNYFGTIKLKERKKHLR